MMFVGRPQTLVGASSRCDDHDRYDDHRYDDDRYDDHRYDDDRYEPKIADGVEQP
jgi:hypothetical protein